MEVTATPRATGWQGAYVPQLKYRNPVPVEAELTSEHLHTSDDTQRQPTSIRDIRLSMAQQAPQRVQDPSPPQSLMPPSASVDNFSRTTPPKKKSSLFGGLFAVKEPSQVALNQVAAQLMAQHGGTTARKVPNVSMEKMPQHVPKVNAKWDGVPDAVKQRERREKERARTATRESITSSNGKSRSSGQSGRPGLETRASHASSGSREDVPRSQHSHARKHDSYAPNPHRFYAQSVNSSGDLAAQQRPESPEEESRPSTGFSHGPSVQSASSVSFANHASTSSRSDSHKRAGSKNKNTSKRTSRTMASGALAPVDAVPEQTRSPDTTPRECSPITPPQRGPEFGPMIQAPIERRDNVPGTSTKPADAPAQASAPQWKPNPAFLAGEAQEFQLPSDDDQSIRSHSTVATRLADIEKRPDSSRDRLGLRASMTVKGGKPWDPKAYPYDRPESANDSTNAQLRPKNNISKAFGSFLKRES
jgi:hypothetical protein